MKPFKFLLILLITIFTFSKPAFAGDFDWVRDFNLQAKANPTGFRASLATRFELGSAQVVTVIKSTGSPADAYIILRLGEISGKSEEYVIDKYNLYKNKGWGRLAKSLGIKPGSHEFHALKQGHDLGSANNKQGKILNFGSNRSFLLVLTSHILKEEVGNRAAR